MLPPRKPEEEELMNQVDCGQALKAYRVTKDLSQRQISKEIREGGKTLAQATISLAERGVYTDETLTILLDYYDTTLEELESWWTRYQEFMAG